MRHTTTHYNGGRRSGRGARTTTFFFFQQLLNFFQLQLNFRAHTLTRISTTGQTDNISTSNGTFVNTTAGKNFNLPILRGNNWVHFIRLIGRVSNVFPILNTIGSSMGVITAFNGSNSGLLITKHFAHCVIRGKRVPIQNGKLQLVTTHHFFQLNFQHKNFLNCKNEHIITFVTATHVDNGEGTTRSGRYNGRCNGLSSCLFVLRYHYPPIQQNG